jgi:hypothetical protein
MSSTLFTLSKSRREFGTSRVIRGLDLVGGGGRAKATRMMDGCTCDGLAVAVTRGIRRGLQRDGLARSAWCKQGSARGAAPGIHARTRYSTRRPERVRELEITPWAGSTATEPHPRPAVRVQGPVRDATGTFPPWLLEGCQAIAFCPAASVAEPRLIVPFLTLSLPLRVRHVHRVCQLGCIFNINVPRRWTSVFPKDGR